MPELNIASCDWNAYITLLRQQDVLWARHRDNISQSSYLRCLEGRPSRVVPAFVG